MAERSVMGRDLDRKRAYEFILEDEMMPGLLFDRNELRARIPFLSHATLSLA